MASKNRDPSSVVQQPHYLEEVPIDKPYLRNTPPQLDRVTSLKTKGGVYRWARRLTAAVAWPPGKSLEGFEKWMKKSMAEAARIATIVTKETGIQHDAGHFFGIMMRGGMDAPDALGTQPAHMRGLPGPVQEYLMDKNRTRRFIGRPVKNLLDADISVNQLYGFKNYLLHDVDWKGLPPDLKQRLAYTNEPFEKVLGAAEGSVVDEVNNKSLLTQLENEIKISDAKAVGVVPGEEPGKVTTVQMDPKERAAFNELSNQPKTGDILTSYQNKSKVSDLFSGLQISKRALRWGIPAVGGLGATLSIGDAQARGELAEDTGYWLDHVQANIAKIEAGADTVGAVPSWASVYAEPAGLIAGGVNLAIDLGRSTLQELSPSMQEHMVAVDEHSQQAAEFDIRKQRYQGEYSALFGASESKGLLLKHQKLQQYREYRAGGGDAAVSEGMTRKQVIELGQGNLRVKNRGIQQRADKSGMSFEDQRVYEAGGGKKKQGDNRLSMQRVMEIGQSNLNVQEEQLRLNYLF